MRFYYDGNKNRQTHIKRECFTWNILFATQISISSCKADIHNPSLQLCWQGLASLLAHERSRFAICFVYIRRIDLVNNILKKELDEWQGATGDRTMSTASQVIWMNCKDELKKSMYHREGQNTFCPQHHGMFHVKHFSGWIFAFFWREYDKRNGQNNCDSKSEGWSRKNDHFD